MLKKQLWICSIVGALAVILGVMCTHRLPPVLTAAELNTCQTAVQYHFIHVLAMMVIALTNRNYTFLHRSLDRMRTLLQSSNSCSTRMPFSGCNTTHMYVNN